MVTERWNDDRLDDLHFLVKANDKRLDKVGEMVESHDKDLTTMSRRSTDNAQFKLVLFAVIASGIVQAILIIFLHAAG